MKTTILFLFVMIFWSFTALSFAETKANYAKENSGDIDHITAQAIPEKIAKLEHDIASINLLLAQMRSALAGQVPLASQGDPHSFQKEIMTEQLEQEWNYFDSEDFENH